MLFDLRGRGRRTTVRIIYIGLAVLLGVGLVGFGIGGGFGGGGLFSSVANNEGARSASFAKQVAKYRKLTQQQPQNVAGWEKLTKVLLNEAGGEAFKSPNGVLTPKGKKVYEEAADAWNRYVALKPPHPSVPLAKEMVLIFGEEGLNQPSSAVGVLQLIVAAEPSNASYYGFLAEYAYLAGDDRVGDLASAKAVSLAPVGQRTHLKTQLASIKKQIHEKTSGTGSTGAGAAATTPGGGTITAPSATTSTATTSGGK
jgi:predicted Zn-dependent protease